MGKIRLISKVIPPQPGSQTIATHILINMPRSKGNQKMIFGQLIEYNMRNIFPYPFLKNKIGHISGSIV